MMETLLEGLQAQGLLGCGYQGKLTYIPQPSFITITSPVSRCVTCMGTRGARALLQAAPQEAHPTPPQADGHTGPGAEA